MLEIGLAFYSNIKQKGHIQLHTTSLPPCLNVTHLVLLGSCWSMLIPKSFWKQWFQGTPWPVLLMVRHVMVVVLKHCINESWLQCGSDSFVWLSCLLYWPFCQACCHGQILRQWFWYTSRARTEEWVVGSGTDPLRTSQEQSLLITLSH